MDAEATRGDKNVHFRDSSSQGPLLTYKRRRQPQPQPQPQIQPEPQQEQEPQAQPQPEPAQELTPPAQPLLEPALEHEAADVPGQQSKDTFWKSRDMGWKYGIMIDENRQHWKCMYCGLIRYGGGVSRLKRHLAGDLDVKMCPKVPADVAAEIREHLRKKRERRRKRAAQYGCNNVKTKSSSDDANAEDIQPADSMIPVGMGTSVLEEVTNQTSMAHQDPTSSMVSMLRVRDIGWEHAVDLDGNKRRWQCKFCSLCRSGGVTTLKAHLTDDSCPNVPKEVTKKVLNFIEEKRTTRLLLNTYDFRVDEAQDFDSQIQGEGTLHCDNDHETSKNAADMQILDKRTLDEVVDFRNQCSAESSRQPVEHHDPPEEQWSMDHDSTHQLINKKLQTTDKNTKNLQTKKIRCKTGFNIRKHIIIVDEAARHWRCRYCGMDVHGKKFRLQYHLAGAFRYPKCPSVPKEVFGRARHHVKTTRKLKMNKDGQQIPSRQHILEQSVEELQKSSTLCGNHPQLSSINNECSEVHNCPARLKDSAWEYSLIYDKDKGHWKCRWCSIEGYHGVTRLKWHLIGWQDCPQCQEVPKEVAEKIRDQMMSKEEEKSGRSGPFDDNVSCDVLHSSKNSQFDQDHDHRTAGMHDGCPSQGFEHSNSKSKACDILSNTTLCAQNSVNPQEGHEQQRKEAAAPPEPACQQDQGMQCQLQHQKMMEEGPHENGLCSDTNKPEKQRSDSRTNDCWRYVLDRLMHLPDVQEDGIGACIRDALLYGCAELGTVPDKVEMDPDKVADLNTAKCQNVLMDVLRSESFALLCNVLCRTVHQDEERTRYFDFGMIDSRMRNGNYGHTPRLFMRDLKLLWEDLKVAGQDIIYLANSLSSFTEASYVKLVGSERGSDSDDGELKEAMVISSEPRNLLRSDDSVPSASQGFSQLDQLGPADRSGTPKGITCNKCGKEAKGGSVLKCNRCMLSCHVSCIEPPDPSISTGSWCCKNCSTTCNDPLKGALVLAHYGPNCLHGNCAVCDRPEVCRSPKCEDASIDNSRAMVISSVDSLKDMELPDIDTVGSCKICGGPEENDKRFLICGHVHCPYKYYHICCLKSEQIASDVQRDKPCWYCPSCLCRVCLSDKDDDLTILCDGCDEAYHLYCTMPRRTSIPKGQWYCSSCSMQRAEDGMKQYERRMLKRHRKDDTGRQNRCYEGLDLLLSAAEQLGADEQLVT